MPVFCLNLYPNLNQNENRDQDPSRNVRIRRTADAARDSVSMFLCGKYFSFILSGPAGQRESIND